MEVAAADRMMEVAKNPRDLVVTLGMENGEYCGWTVSRGTVGENKVLIEYPGNIKNTDKWGLLFHLSHILNHVADQAFDAIRNGQVPDYLDRGMVGELIEHLRSNDVADSSEVLRPKPELRTLRCWCGDRYDWAARTRDNAVRDGDEVIYLARCHSGHAIDVETFYAETKPEKSQPDLQIILACTKCRNVLPKAADERWKWKDEAMENGEITCPHCHILVDVTDLAAITVPVSFDDGYGHSGGAGGGHF